MLTDSFFQQGVTHEVCEDYAAHGQNYVVIADGCSNGGGPRIDTDWGARLLTNAAEKHMTALTGPAESGYAAFLDLVALTAHGHCYNLTLPPECLTATLAVAYLRGDEISTLLVGDGVWGGRKRDGTWRITNFSAKRGGKANAAAPYYLKYRLFKGETERYFDLFGGDYTRKTYTVDMGTLAKREESGFGEHDIALNPEEPFFRGSFPTKDYDLVFIGSDGLSSFYRQVKTTTSKHNEPVELLDVLGVLLDVDHFRPGFLRLQRQWAWKRSVSGSFVARDWHNSDDVSLGAIRVG